MPHVVAASDSIHEALTSSAADTLRAPLPTPAFRPVRSLLAYLQSLITPARRSPVRRQRQCLHTAHEFERPVDTLARKHPYIFIKAMSG
jgi:hypothetical protein